MATNPQFPPASIAWITEAWAPGIYTWFWDALIRGVGPVWGPGDEVSSYWRDPGHNFSVGGSQDSQHLVALGIDLTFTRVDSKQAALRGATAQGLVAVDEGTHLHLQAFPRGIIRSGGLLDRIGF